MRKTKGSRQGTRDIFSRDRREKKTVSQFLKEFREGDKVRIDPDPASHRALPDKKFVGRTGTVTGRRGDAYVVETRQGDSMKTVIITPEHLQVVD